MYRNPAYQRPKETLLDLYGDKLIDSLTELAENGKLSLLGVNDAFVFSALVDPALSEEIRVDIKRYIVSDVPKDGVLTIVSYSDKGYQIKPWRIINAAVNDRNGREEYTVMKRESYSSTYVTYFRDAAFLKTKYTTGNAELPDIDFDLLARLLYSSASSGDSVIYRIMRKMALKEPVPASWLSEILQEASPDALGNLCYLAVQYNSIKTLQILTYDPDKSISIGKPIAEALKPHAAYINNANVLEEIENLRLGDALAADDAEQIGEILIERKARDDDTYGPYGEGTGGDWNIRRIPEEFNDYEDTAVNLLGWALIFGAENTIKLIMTLRDGKDYAKALPDGLDLDAFAYYGEKLRFFYDWLSDLRVKYPEDYMHPPTLEEMVDATGLKFIDSIIRDETRDGEEGALGEALVKTVHALDLENDAALALVQRYADKLTDKDIATPPNTDGMTLLHLAADSDNEPLIRLLLDKNPSARHATNKHKAKPFSYLSKDMAKKLAPDFDESMDDEKAKNHYKYNARRQVLLDYNPNGWLSDEDVTQILKDNGEEPEGDDGEYTERQLDRQREAENEYNGEYARDFLKELNDEAPFFIDGKNYSDINNYIDLDNRIKVERIGNRLFINGDLVQKLTYGASEDRDKYRPSALLNVSPLESYE